MGKYIMRGLAHIGIYTEDPKACADFYVENLGFHPYHHKSGDMEIYFVENGGCVMEFVPNKPDHPVDGLVNHVCFEVQGIEDLVAELEAKGIQMESGVNVLPDLFPTPVKNAFFRGPAGERIELFDYTK